MTKIRMNIYHKLVNEVPNIRCRYHQLRDGQTALYQRLYAWLALLGMNIGYHILHLPSLTIDVNLYPDAHKKLLLDTSESALSLRESPKALAKRMAAYDVISFDVFDTLIFRPFSKPSDLFFMVGEKLQYLDFERIRVEMEWKAREDNIKTGGHGEITLSQIYNYIETYVGIPKEKGMALEIETELAYCFPNPYMQELLKELKKYGKEIIAISDMYLPGSVIRTMLDQCGFQEIKDIYVSCELGKSKNEGSLFTLVKEIYGVYKKFFHIGDNQISDIKRAKEKGFATEYYKNVNEAGKPYRIEDMAAISGSMYRGIVNAHIHNGLKEYSKEYEMGFIYGGPMVLGYCQFIHEYVRTHDIDKILFLARDGDILNQAYKILYPEEWGEGKTEYVYWSRLAATKMAAKYFKYDYFRRFLYHKVNQGYAMEEIFRSMELGDMLEKMEKQGILDSGHSSKRVGKVLLTDKNVELVKQFLIEHWEEVLAHYEDQLAAGKIYYEKVLRSKKKVIAVDVGWAGSGAVTLNHIVNDIWHLDCEIIGLLLGTNSAHNAEPNASEPLLYSGQLVSYAFSQSHNREMWKKHNPNRGDNLVVEGLFSSAREGSFVGFEMDGDGKVAVRCKEVDVGQYEELQDGILEYVKFIFKHQLFSIHMVQDINKTLTFLYKEYSNQMQHVTEINI